MNIKHLSVFASGSGSNAENLIRFFANYPHIEVSLVLSNKKDAPVHKRAAALGVKSVSFTREDFTETGRVLQLLREHKTDFVVLAGFLWLVPLNIIEEYAGRIINIHPALLPDYGGRGMYGMNVHRAVLENKEKESGITIHYVNPHYDEGNIIFQARCPVDENDTPESLAEKVHQLEYKYFPEVVKDLVERI